MRVLSVLILAICLISVNCTKKYNIFKVSKLNWYAAFQDCLTRGLQLATINSSDEQDDIEQVINKTGASKDWLWTSGTDQGEEGNFFWMSTGSPITYSKWITPQPDNAGGHENCLHIWNKNGVYSWNDWQCEKKLYYICEEKPANSNVVDIDVRLADKK